MRNITVAKTKATVFGTTKRKGTPQILPPKSKKASHICNLQTKGLHGFCLHNLLSATTFSSVGITHQYPVWLAGCGQVNIFKNLFDYTNSFIHTLPSVTINKKAHMTQRDKIVTKLIANMTIF